MILIARLSIIESLLVYASLVHSRLWIEQTLNLKIQNVGCFKKEGRILSTKKFLKHSLCSLN